MRIFYGKTEGEERKTTFQKFQLGCYPIGDQGIKLENQQLYLKNLKVKFGAVLPKEKACLSMSSACCCGLDSLVKAQGVRRNAWKVK